MKRATATLAVLGIFLAGSIAGVIGAQLFYLRSIREPGSMVRWGTRLLAKDLKRDLDLTSEQARQVDVILAQTRRDTIALRDKYKPEFIAVLKQSRHRIEDILTPEQREEFKKLRERRFARFRRWAGGR